MAGQTTNKQRIWMGEQTKSLDGWTNNKVWMAGQRFSEQQQTIKQNTVSFFGWLFYCQK